MGVILCIIKNDISLSLLKERIAFGLITFFLSLFPVVLQYNYV